MGSSPISPYPSLLISPPFPGAMFLMAYMMALILIFCHWISAPLAAGNDYSNPYLSCICMSFQASRLPFNGLATGLECILQHRLQPADTPLSHPSNLLP